MATQTKPVLTKSRGAQIMELAELLRPALMEKLGQCRDVDNQHVQLARIRGIALVIAQELVKSREEAA